MSTPSRFKLTLQSARKWVPQVWIFRPGKATNSSGFVSGHGFSRADNSLQMNCHPERSTPGAPIALGREWGKRSEGSAVGDVHHSKKNGITFWIKTAQAFLLAIAVCFSLGAGTSSERYNDLSHRMMCTCGCSQLLGECNHVGCPSSGPMLRELSAAISGGATDKEILASFTAKYGATVLAAPTTHGFDLVAWIAPFAVFGAALLGTILLVRHWSIGRTALAAQAADPTIDALREKIRRETDSGVNGGI